MREKATHLGLISNDNKAAIYNIIAQFSYEVKLGKLVIALALVAW